MLGCTLLGMFTGHVWNNRTVYSTGYGWVDHESGMTISGIYDEWRLAERLPRLAFVKKTPDAREVQLVGLLHEIGKSVSHTPFETTEEFL